MIWDWNESNLLSHSTNQICLLTYIRVIINGGMYSWLVAWPFQRHLLMPTISNWWTWTWSCDHVREHGHTPIPLSQHLWSFQCLSDSFVLRATRALVGFPMERPTKGSKPFNPLTCLDSNAVYYYSGHQLEEWHNIQWFCSTILPFWIKQY